MHRFPPAFDTIGQAITGHFGGNAIQKQLREQRQQDANWRHIRARMEVMVGCCGRDATFAAAREWAYFDRGFRIERDPQHRLTRIGGLIDGGDLVEDCISLGHFFWADSWRLSVDSSPAHSTWPRSSRRWASAYPYILFGQSTGGALLRRSVGCRGAASGTVGQLGSGYRQSL